MIKINIEKLLSSGTIYIDLSIDGYLVKVITEKVNCIIPWQAVNSIINWYGSCDGIESDSLALEELINICQKLSNKDAAEKMIKFALKNYGYTFHHQSTIQGYYSRKARIGCTPYKGRFGAGYIIHKARYDCTRYHHAEYWIEPLFK